MRMSTFYKYWTVVLAAVFLAVVYPSRLAAQTPAAAPAPPLQRWFEIDNFMLYSRYRFISNSADVTTSNHLQYKDAFRARFNIDAEKRFTINVGHFTGGTFISTWNNWGVGTGGNGAFNGSDHYVKQLFASAKPVKGLELQYGGLYIIRGETDDIASYDEDGYLAGERVTLKRPKELYLDEISVTRGFLGPNDDPNLFKRWDGLENPNYTQVLVGKRLAKRVAASIDYSSLAGADTIRAAVTLRLDGITPISTLKYEQYRRVNAHAAAGFALWADRTLPARVRVQGGYVTIDQFYGGWNADRIQTGRRFFAVASIPIAGPVAAQLFATHALSSPYSITLKQRYEAVISYDVLQSLHRARLF